MSRRTGSGLTLTLLCLVLLVLGFLGGRYAGHYFGNPEGAPDLQASLRGMERVEVSSAYMDRLLIVKDETVPYNNIRLVLSVPVQVTWTADMSLVSFERQEDGAFLVRLPQVVAGEARYEVERASNLDVSTGFGMSSTWASFQDVFALFSKAVEEDRKALGAELGKAEHLARAEQALRRMILAAAAARGIEVRFAPPAD